MGGGCVVSGLKGSRLFDVVLTLRASAGRDMRPAAHLLFFASPKKRRQKKGDPTGRVPALRCGQPAMLASGHGQSGVQSRGRAQRWPAPKPLWLRLRRGACGVARAPQDARASWTDSPRLSERSAPARSEFCGAPRTRRGAGLPRSDAQGSQTWGRLFFAYFLLATQKKVGAPPGAHPGQPMRAASTGHRTTANDPTPKAPLPKGAREPGSATAAPRTRP